MLAILFLSSAVVALALLAYGILRAGPYSDVALFVAIVLGVVNSIIGLLARRHERARRLNRSSASSAPMNHSVAAKRRFVTVVIVLGALGLALVGCGLFFRSDLAMVAIGVGICVLAVDGLIILRLRPVR